MDKTTARELLLLQEHLDNDSDNSPGFYHYTDYYDRGNMRIVRGNKSKDERLNFLLPDNPESSELDWWILYAVSVLKLVDAEGVISYLRVEKSRHPELLFTAEDRRIIVRRLNMLARWGFLIKLSYVANTDIDVCDAEQVYDLEQKVSSEKALLEKQASVAVSLDDEYMDEDSEDEVNYVSYSNVEYTNRLNENARAYHDRRNGSPTFSNDRRLVKKYYGERASVVALYTTEEDTYHWIKDRFGSGVPAYAGNPIVQMSYMQMGLAAVGHTVSRLCTLPSFQCFKSGKVNSKYNGTFVIPSEMEFKITKKGGADFTYNCGIFSNYYFPGKGRLLPRHAQQNLTETFYRIKNYIGINGMRETERGKRDCFVIVVVNDSIDLAKFMHLLMKKKDMISVAESNRIFFTGEGILASDLGMERVLGFKFDETEEEGYSLFPVKLPIF